MAKLKPSEELIGDPMKALDAIKAGQQPEPIDALFLCGEAIFVLEQEMMRRADGPCPEVWKVRPTGESKYADIFRRLELMDADLSPAQQVAFFGARSKLPPSEDGPCAEAMFICTAALDMLAIPGKPRRTVVGVADALGVDARDVLWMKHYLNRMAWRIDRSGENTALLYILARDAAIAVFLEEDLLAPHVSAEWPRWQKWLAEHRAMGPVTSDDFPGVCPRCESRCSCAAR